jgi:CRISP-associated protein Cas1
MSAIYVKEQGAVVGRRGERLVVRKQREVLDEFPLSQITQLVLMGNVQLTTQALKTLVKRDIDVVYLSSYGKFEVRPEGNGSKHVALRQRQLQMVKDAAVALTQARAIVDGKIHNQRVILQRQVRRLAESGGQTRGMAVYPRQRAQFDKALAGMVQMQQQLPQANSLDVLRGYEGKAAAYYFEAIRTLLDPAWGFARRDYYPPPDPFNALLSFAYSLLLKDVRAAVHIVGLDLYAGFFHEVRYNRPSLALDLMEEWRPLIADSLSLELVNRGSLVPEQFVQTGRKERPVELGEAGMVRVLEAYGQRLQTRVYHPLVGPGGDTTLQHALVLQARRLAQVIAGKESAYVPVKAK